jgi:hypothetical protein
MAVRGDEVRKEAVTRAGVLSPQQAGDPRETGFLSKLEDLHAIGIALSQERDI